MLYRKMAVPLGHLQSFMTKYCSDSDRWYPRLGKVGGGRMSKIVKSEVIDSRFI